MSTDKKLVVLVTGANKGIGYATARRLGQMNYAVWLGCRDRARGEQAVANLRREGVEASLLLLDVTDAKGVTEAVEKLGAKAPALDVLINNAGMHFGLPPSTGEESIEDIRTIFETNTFGPVRVTQAFLPMLRKSQAARIVMVSSGLGSHALTKDITSEIWGVSLAGYCASKSALNMFTLKFAKELLAEGIKVNAVDPGLTATELGGPLASRTPEEACEVIVRLATIDGFGPTGGFYRNYDSDKQLLSLPW